MKLMVQGKEEVVTEFLTVAELLLLLNVEMPQYVSVQVNEQFVPREDFAGLMLSEGDRVDLIYFMGGGSLRCS